MLTPLQLLPLLSLPLALWLVILTILYLRLLFHYNRFTADTPKKDLLDTLNQLLKTVLKNQKDIDLVNRRLDLKIAKDQAHFTKFALKRFNPFTNTGGDQSFVLCLLDETSSGFVISSLHSRENTRLYAKRIEKGQSPDQALSDEETAALAAAQK